MLQDKDSIFVSSNSTLSIVFYCSYHSYCDFMLRYVSVSEPGR